MPGGRGYMVQVESGRPATIEPVALARAGVDYVLTCLSDDRAISSRVAQAFGKGGACFTPLETGAIVERARQFSTGSSLPTVAIRKWLAAYIEAQWGSDAQLVFADPWMKVSDFARHARQPYFSFENVPYHFPSGGDVYQRLTEGDRVTGTHAFIAFIIAPPVDAPPPGATIDAEYAERLVRHTQAVLASAYDREGYVVWGRE